MANSTILYVCTEDGLGIVNKPGTSDEWLPPRLVLQGRALASAWAHPGPPIRVAVATWEGELLLSENGGRTWSPEPPLESLAALFAGDDAAVLYAVLQSGSIVRSDDGVTWVTADGAVPSGVQIQAGEPALLAGANIYLLAERSDEQVLLRGSIQGGNWRVLPLEGVEAVARDAASGTLYAMTEAGVQSSTDGGANWSLMQASPQDGNAILAIPGAAGKPPSLVAGAPSGLFYSADGTSWQPVQLPHAGVVTALLSDPQRRDRLYAATATGYLYESGNRGQAWQPINAQAFPPVSSLFAIRI